MRFSFLTEDDIIAAVENPCLNDGFCDVGLHCDVDAFSDGTAPCRYICFDTDDTSCCVEADEDVRCAEENEMCATTAPATSFGDFDC